MSKLLLHSKLCLFLLLAALAATSMAQSKVETPVTNWVLQDVAKVTSNGAQISQPDYSPKDWIKAVVPGTVLTSMVAAGIYPEPLYGENNRSIPESLCRTAYWYRAQINVPKSKGKDHTWLRFDGINYTAEVWVNGQPAGSMKGAFTRGLFDISKLLGNSNKATIAVQIMPPPHPGNPAEQTVALGTGRNGGAIGADGPTFNATVGWDWIAGIRDRAMGLWQGVAVKSTGDVLIEDPFVVSTLNQDHSKADLTVKVTLHNVTDQTVSGTLTGEIKGANTVGPATFELKPNQSQELRIPVTLHDPKLWWPNTYGPQNRYVLELGCTSARGGKETTVSDASNTSFAIRSIEYFRNGGKDLTISVNGVPIFCKGGNWGMDEAMKRIPRSRLEAMIRLHRDANCTMIRNWIGMSTEEDFYDLCDQYGILIWDDFWLANPVDGPVPEDNDTFLKNVKEKIVRFRNHPSIAVWCGRNEGMPPTVLNDGMAQMTKDLDGTRFYQPHSSSLNGVGGGGPYSYHKPADYFNFKDAFHTEVGGPSIPTMEAIKAMMPKKDWWPPLNDDWAQHDLCKGAQQGDKYPAMLASRFGPITGFADFVRKAQLANYESYRAIFEGRAEKLFAPASGVLLWMSSPSQPSFVWQLYSYDLEPTAAMFGTKKGSEPIHIQMNDSTGQVTMVNTTPVAITDVHVLALIVDLDGNVILKKETKGKAPASAAMQVFTLPLDTPKGGPLFVFLQATDSDSNLYSKNFYWCSKPDPSNHYTPGDFSGLQSLKPAFLSASAKIVSKVKNTIEVEVTNTSPVVALMCHLQLRDKTTGERILPVYYSDNYFSLLPESLSTSKTITIEAPDSKVKPENWVVDIDGWNVSLKDSKMVELNKDMMDLGTPIPIAHTAPIPGVIRNLSPANLPKFDNDDAFVDGGFVRTTDASIDMKVIDGMNGKGTYPESLYQTSRSGEFTYTIPIPRQYWGKDLVLRLHFVDTQSDAIGKRLFNIDLNGNRLLTDLDVFLEAGGKGKAVIEVVKGAQVDQFGNIVLSFTRGKAGFPTICAIQILEK